jgi:hypothetical protein
MPLDTMASTRLRRSPCSYPEVNFTKHMAHILKVLKSSLTATEEQQIIEDNKYRQPHSF